MEKIILLAFILGQLVRQLSGQPNCALNQAVMTCHYEIPQMIPPNVHNVFIEDFNGSLESYKFTDASWKSVTHLDIESHVNSYELKAGTFSPLIFLKRLGFHISLFLVMDKNVFAGLDNVEVLDLSGCRRLYIDDKTMYPSFLDALSGKGVLPKINTLNLINVGNFGSRPLFVDADTVRMINDRGIKSLMLGKQTILLDVDIYEVWPSPPYDPSPVQSIYASSVVAVVLQSSNKRRLIDFPVFEVVKNLKNITLSNLTVNTDIDSSIEQHKSHTLCRNDSLGRTVLFTLILLVEELNFQNILFPIGEFYDLIDAYECTLMRLKRLKINNCGIEKINITWTIPEKAYLDEIDLSNNDIYYAFVKGNMQSKRLILSNNKLQKMNSFPEFSQVFVTWPMLEYLDLGWNGLLNLPRGIFSRNIQLKKLFLNDNGLTSVPITLTDLKAIQFLDLRNNLIKSLDANAIVDLEKLIKVFNTTVYLTMNIFECSCETRDFVKWISSITNHRRIYNCNMEGKTVTIGDETYRECKFLCYRDSLYVGITIMCLIVVSVVILVIVKRYLTLSKRAFDNDRQAFITQFLGENSVCNNNGHIENTNETFEGQSLEFLVMLAHHSDDNTKCSDTIYDPLNNGLKSLLRTNKDLVFFGLDKERPGASIFTEMERCTQISCVFACVVTKDFCMDHMCQSYLNNAHIEGKPIVFLICERVVEDFPQIMKAMLRTAYTVSIYNEDQTPVWDTICKDIITLAVKANKKSEPNYSVKTCLLQTVCTCARSTFKVSSEEGTSELIEM